MEFERSDRFEPDLDWEVVDHDTLLRELTDEQITMMIFYKATIRTHTHLYRRIIPAEIKDWATILRNMS
jgi:hypothetical protein